MWSFLFPPSLRSFPPLYSVADPEGGKSGLGLSSSLAVDFSNSQPRNKLEILGNMLHCWMPGSATWCGPQPNVWIRHCLYSISLCYLSICCFLPSFLSTSFFFLSFSILLSFPFRVFLHSLPPFILIRSHHSPLILCFYPFPFNFSIFRSLFLSSLLLLLSWYNKKF